MKKIYILAILFVVVACEGDIGMDGLGHYSGGDRYNAFEENPFVSVSDVPTSTFSVDADGASYANVRRFINEATRPPIAAVRTEELINYFPMNYLDTEVDHPISLNGEVSACPWQEGNKLVRIGIKGKTLLPENYPSSNIVFLIDVSGSMNGYDRLTLLKMGIEMMINTMSDNDRVAIVTYAGAAEVALSSTPVSQKKKILSQLNTLSADGSTAGAEGIKTAYSIAKENFIEGGNNRIILGTDGDFNVGVSSQEELIKLIEEKRDQGIFLTVVGVGRGNLNDGMMEQVADRGNGTYEYLDNERQAKKVFVEEYHKFFPAAKDVKVQIQFNPALVTSYRLIGYENRLLENEDFKNDEKDAGDISAGQTITALYEIVPKISLPALRSEQTFTIDFRYKQPNENVSIPMTLNIFDEGKSFSEASENMRFAGSLAAFGMFLRNSAFKGTITHTDIKQYAENAKTFDPFGHRVEFIELLNRLK